MTKQNKKTEEENNQNSLYQTINSLDVSLVFPASIERMHLKRSPLGANFKIYERKEIKLNMTCQINTRAACEMKPNTNAN